MRRCVITILSWAMAMVGASLAPEPHPDIVTASGRWPANPLAPMGPQMAPARCVDVLMLGFRGSGEHPRGRTREGKATRESGLPWKPNDFVQPDFAAQRQRFGVTAAEDRLGTTLGAMYEALHHRVTARGQTVGFWSVGVDEATGFGYGALYAAPPVDVVGLGRYLDTIAVDSLMLEFMPVLERLVLGEAGRPAWCPNTNIVVGGFSQGAILARALVSNAQQLLRARRIATGPIGDVVLVGDPLFRRHEHRRHGVVHPSDHQMDGLLRLDLVALCDRNRFMKALCAVTALGSGSVRSWFREVWSSLRVFAEQHPRLLRTSTSQLEQRGVRLHMVCDSGDVVCSPIRVISTLRWDSDFPELFTGRPERTIHGNYHRTVPWDDVVSGFWSSRVRAPHDLNQSTTSST